MSKVSAPPKSSSPPLLPPLLPPGRQASAKASAGGSVGAMRGKDSRLLKVVYQDKAERQNPRAGWQPKPREFKMVWHDSGKRLDSRGKAFSAVRQLVNARRPQQVINVVGRAGSAAVEARVENEVYLSENQLRLAQASSQPPASEAAAQFLSPAEALQYEDDKVFASVTGAALKNASDMPAAERQNHLDALNYLSASSGEFSRIQDLAQKLEAGTITPKEHQEFCALVHAHKENIPLVQNHLASLNLDGLGTQSREAVDALYTRLADRHMELADIYARHDADIPSRPALTRAERGAFHLLQTRAMIHALDHYSAAVQESSLKPEEKTAALNFCRQIKGHLQQHETELNEQIARPRPGAAFAEALALPVGGKNSLKPENLTELQQHWRAVLSGAKEAPLIPLPSASYAHNDMLAAFADSYPALRGADKTSLPPMKEFYQQGLSQALNERPWPVIDKQVACTIEGRKRNLRSVITPASSQSAKLAKPYAGGGIASPTRSQYAHPVNLAESVLRNEQGQTLYRGWRMGVLDSYDITPKHLRRMSDRQIGEMIIDLRSPTASSDPSDPLFGSPAVLTKRARASSAGAKKLAGALRQAAADTMAKDMAATMLAANPVLYRRALAGEVVDLPVSSVSLMTPDHIRRGKSAEKTMLAHQQRALTKLANQGEPLTLTSRNPQGELRQVRLRARVRQFSFGVNAGALRGAGKMSGNPKLWQKLAGWGLSAKTNDPELTRLLGARGSTDVGGAVDDALQNLSRRIDAPERALRANELYGRLAGERDALIARRHDLMTRPDSASDRTATITRGQRLNELQRTTSRLAESNRQLAQAEQDLRQSDPAFARTAGQRDALIARQNHITQLAGQVKQMWNENRFTTQGREPYKMVSRLGALLNALGENPVINCKSGKDRTGQYDAEVKYVSAFMDNQPGAQPPPLDAAPYPAARRARTRFALNTGNLEMQQNNTGLPGYKVKLPRLYDQMQAHAIPSYRGGGAYVGS